MKERISATIDKETLSIIKELLKKGKYRNKSHIIEEAIKIMKKNE
ncbi:MAG: ribbon-helix-helix protein, CopG family [archaeon]